MRSNGLKPKAAIRLIEVGRRFSARLNDVTRHRLDAMPLEEYVLFTNPAPSSHYRSNRIRGVVKSV